MGRIHWVCCYKATVTFSRIAVYFSLPYEGDAVLDMRAHGQSCRTEAHVAHPTDVARLARQLFYHYLYSTGAKVGTPVNHFQGLGSVLARITPE